MKRLSLSGSVLIKSGFGGLFAAIIFKFRQYKLSATKLFPAIKNQIENLISILRGTLCHRW